MSDEDAFRASFYALLARLTLKPPPADLLADLGGLGGDDGTAIGAALAALGEAARATDAAAADEEHMAVFVGITRGEVVPYASYYLTGFLHEKPLADVRETLARLGAARASDLPEPEDHIGILCDAMAGLITGSLDVSGLTAQKDFFNRHIAPWADTLFRDIEAAPSARFYRPVGQLGRAFLAVEQEAFTMVGEKGEG